MAAAVAVVGGIITAPTLAFAQGAKAATASDWNSVAQCEAGGDWSINYSGDGLSVGGLQFQNPSWQDALSYLSSRGYNVSGFPQSLHQGMSNVPSTDEQILAGEALLHLQGAGAWTTVSDGCAHLGMSMFDGGPNPWGLSGASWPGSGGTAAAPPPASAGSGQTPAPVASSGGEAEDGDADGTRPAPAPANAPSAPAAVASATGRTHTVVQGEWLIKLAEHYYGGDWKKWRLIYDANVDVIGPNPDLIFPGQVLTIPAG